MCERAAELGHSLLFPVICRYCRMHIYLFATPEGGFAIFDDVGGDWPKHDCWGVHQATTRYTDLDPTFTKDYPFPVPASIQHRTASAGSQVVGTVLRQDQPSRGTDLSESQIFDGTSVLHVALAGGNYIGRCVRGFVQLREGRSVLTAVEVLSPPEPTSPAQRPTPTELTQLRASDLWTLQDLANTLATTSPTAAATLRQALDAFLNGYTLAGVFFVARLLLTAPISTSVKASLVRLTLVGLVDLKLHSVLPGLVNRLSGGTLAALDAETRRSLERASSLAELQKKHTARARLQEALDRRFRKESNYFRRTEGALVDEFKQFWQVT
jgi:hypothetical protein